MKRYILNEGVDIRKLFGYGHKRSLNEAVINSITVRNVRILFNTGMSVNNAMEEKEYANVYQICIGNPELEGYAEEVGKGYKNCMEWSNKWEELIQNNDFNNWFEDLGETVGRAKEISKILGCFIVITDDDFMPMRFFYNGNEL